MSTEARHKTAFVTVATSTSQHLMTTTIPKWYILDVSAVPDSPLRDSLYLSVFYDALQTLQLHLVLFQCLIIILNDSRFSEDFIWYGKLFQTLGSKTLKLLLPCYDVLIIFSSQHVLEKYIVWCLKNRTRLFTNLSSLSRFSK